MQGVFIEGTCFKFKRLQETSVEGARRTPESIWKTLKGQVPLRLIKLIALREIEQVHTPSASARQGEVKISLTEARKGKHH
jgi:hypothetical protein